MAGEFRGIRYSFLSSPLIRFAWKALNPVHKLDLLRRIQILFVCFPLTRFTYYFFSFVKEMVMLLHQPGSPISAQPVPPVLLAQFLSAELILQR